VRRRFSARQRRILALLAGGACEICGDPLPANFHADHRRPFSAGGPTTLLNGQALCARCNLQKGNSMIRLRPWQKEAHSKAIAWFTHEPGHHRFLINAAPGAGKTIAACAIADTLIREGLIDRVVVVAPRSEVVNQWASNFMLVTGRPMSRITGRDADFHALKLDVCATWSAIDALLDGFQALCESHRVLVICDEHHHAATEAAWGFNAETAFAKAPLGIILTGTPTRSDGARMSWIQYDAMGRIDHPEAGSYVLSYGEAVDLGYCRPAVFHRHEGRFRVTFDDGAAMQVSSRQPAKIDDDHPAAKALQRSLDFQKLALTPLRDEQGHPRLDGFQASMVSWASTKLDDLRERMANAGGLVIAPSIGMAEYFTELIERLEGERPIMVHSSMGNADSRIRAFRGSDTRWIVSVGMVGEGVDIPRLRTLVYLPTPLTEVHFRQAVGRVVRSAGPDDDTRAYVVMPAFHRLDEFARRIEAEMPPIRPADEARSMKLCSVCRVECDRGTSHCPNCGHDFPVRRSHFATCPACCRLTPAGAEHCEHCGQTLAQEFELSVEEALRDGVISRGMDFDEKELDFAETHAGRVREAVHRSGDARLIRLLRSVPEEALARLRLILSGDEAA
jgi:superfamily II DNA or RNA helicase